jgi:SCP-2 sterol transfer family protein
MTEEQPTQASSDVPSDLSTLSAEDFAALVSQANDEQLAEIMEGSQRETALREIFARVAEHFDPARARGDSVVHFQITGRPDGGSDDFEMIVRDGNCEVSEDPSEQPRVTLKVEPVPFLKLVSGQASGPELFMSGKLKIDGDLMFAPQIATMFRIPTAPPKEANS